MPAYRRTHGSKFHGHDFLFNSSLRIAKCMTTSRSRIGQGLSKAATAINDSIESIPKRRYVFYTFFSVRKLEHISMAAIQIGHLVDKWLLCRI